MVNQNARLREFAKVFVATRSTVAADIFMRSDMEVITPECLRCFVSERIGIDVCHKIRTNFSRQILHRKRRDNRMSPTELREGVLVVTPHSERHRGRMD